MPLPVLLKRVEQQHFAAFMIFEHQSLGREGAERVVCAHSFVSVTGHNPLFDMDGERELFNWLMTLSHIQDHAREHELVNGLRDGSSE